MNYVNTFNVKTHTYAITVYHTDVVSSNLDQGEVYNIMC
jgi:hypothetical protein